MEPPARHGDDRVGVADALDPYKAPEIRAAADASLAALQRLLRDAGNDVNVREIETKESA